MCIIDFVTSVGLHNQSHPRTDPVVIMAVLNENNDKVLLGRNVNCFSLHAVKHHFDARDEIPSSANGQASSILRWPASLSLANRLMTQCDVSCGKKQASRSGEFGIILHNHGYILFHSSPILSPLTTHFWVCNF